MAISNCKHRNNSQKIKQIATQQKNHLCAKCIFSNWDGKRKIFANSIDLNKALVRRVPSVYAIHVWCTNTKRQSIQNTLGIWVVFLCQCECILFTPTFIDHAFKREITSSHSNNQTEMPAASLSHVQYLCVRVLHVLWESLHVWVVSKMRRDDSIRFCVLYRTLYISIAFLS